MNTEQIKTITKAYNSFPYFMKHVFSESFDKFIEGEHVYNTAKFLQDNKKTARVSARDHFKSSSLYAHFMWKLLRHAHTGLEAHYFSYQEQLSAYHINKIKSLIRRNPYYKSMKDLKPTAEGIIKYTWDNEHILTLEPHGLLAFKRGIHCPLLYVDDPFQDPENKLNPKIITKINRVFVSQIMDMPFRDGELHVVGTPQTNDDFFFDKNIMRRFKVDILPAIADEKNKEVLWAEYMPYEELVERRRERGEKLFNQEYMCTPVWSEDAYFKREEILAVVSDDYTGLRFGQVFDEGKEVVGAWDLGKKRHPAHFVVFKVTNKKMIQIHDKWMDGWDYTKQLEYITGCVKDFRIDRLPYDATRGELESLGEQGLLPSELEPIVFKRQTKFSMATEFEKRVNTQTIQLLNISRTINQILVVDNDLQALETPEGHGDSFFTIAMACMAANKSTDVGITSFNLLGDET